MRHIKLPTLTPLLRLSCTVLLLLVPVRVKAQDIASASVREQVRKELLHPKASPSPHEAVPRNAWEALATLSEEDRVAILQEVVQFGPPETSGRAAAQLILQRRARDATEVIVRRLADAPPGTEASLLRLIASTEQASDLAAIPRHVLRRHISARVPYRRDPERLGPVDLAATLLRASDGAGDHALLLDAALAFPESPEIWLALAAADALDPPQEALAISMFRDPDYSPRLRTSIAVALAPRDPEAEAIAIQRLREAIEASGAVDMWRLASLAQPGTPERAAIRDEYVRFYEAIPQVSMLRVLQSDAAQALTAQALRAENVVVKALAALIAAERWPRWLLTGPEHALTEQEWNAALVFIAHLHPDLAAEVRALSPDVAAFDALRDQIRADGLHAASVHAGGGAMIATGLFLGIN